MIDAFYVHIPFCSRICTYCDFPKMVGDDALKERYVDALIREIAYYQDRLGQVTSIYLGGGTPTALSHPLLEQLMNALKKGINPSLLREYSIEANPLDITPKLAELLVKHGVTRVSLGVQTAHPRLLRFLGRDHQRADVEQAISILRRHHIREINLDFIYGIPSQTLEELKNDISFALSLQPDHLSFYTLILEEKTKLFHDFQHHLFEWPNEDLVADMTETVMRSLPNAGYHQYEISNYSLPGKESWHNLAYWEIRPYLGVGMGAHSQIDAIRFHNAGSVTKYLHLVEQTGCGKIAEDPCDLPLETVLMGLRLQKGISISAFRERFGCELFELYPGLMQSITSGLLKQSVDWLYPTDKGCLLLDFVLRNLEAK